MFFSIPIVIYVCIIPNLQSGFQPHTCIPKRMNNACEQGIGRFLCKGEEARAWTSTKCLQLSLLFIHLVFIESWKATDKRTNVLLLKQGKRNWLLWCRGTFKVNLLTPSAVIIISPYSHAGWRGKNSRKLALVFFSFARPTFFSIRCLL